MFLRYTKNKSPHTLHPNWCSALCSCGFDVGVHLPKVYTHPTPKFIHPQKLSLNLRIGE